jgi:hypothetical protein
MGRSEMAYPFAVYNPHTHLNLKPLTITNTITSFLHDGNLETLIKNVPLVTGIKQSTSFLHDGNLK